MKRFNIGKYFTIISMLLICVVLFLFSYYKEPREAMGAKKLELMADETYSQNHGAYVVITTYNDEVRVILEKKYHTYYRLVDNSDDDIATQSYSYYYKARDFKDIKL